MDRKYHSQQNVSEIILQMDKMHLFRGGRIFYWAEGPVITGPQWVHIHEQVQNLQITCGFLLFKIMFSDMLQRGPAATVTSKK